MPLILLHVEPFLPVSPIRDYIYMLFVQQAIACFNLCVLITIGLAIQWGPVGDVGMVVDTLGKNAILFGTSQQQLSSCLSVMDMFLDQSHPVVNSMVLAEKGQASDKDHVDNLVPTIAHILGEDVLIIYLVSLILPH